MKNQKQKRKHHQTFFVKYDKKKMKNFLKHFTSENNYEFLIFFYFYVFLFENHFNNFEKLKKEKL